MTTSYKQHRWLKRLLNLPEGAGLQVAEVYHMYILHAGEGLTEDVAVKLPDGWEAVIKGSHESQAPHVLNGEIRKRPRLAPVTDFSDFRGRRK